MKLPINISAALILLLLIQLLSPTITMAQTDLSGDSNQTNIFELNAQTLKGLVGKVTVIEDEFGVPHIFAEKTKDAFFMQGFLHARDRFFQMDVTRRSVDGSLAELLGPGNNNTFLLQDTRLRSFGFNDTAAATLPLLQPQTRAILKAYTKGVNSYLSKNPLPGEYQVLKLTKARKWTDADSLNVIKGFAMTVSFTTQDMNFSIIAQNYKTAGTMQNFDGTALFFEDLFRSQPFESSYTIPDATSASTVAQLHSGTEKQTSNQQYQQWSQHLASSIKPETIEMARQLHEEFSRFTYLGNSANSSDQSTGGSNWIALSGKLTDTGQPLLVADPHLLLTTPPIWYQVQITSTDKKDPFNVVGFSVAGAPGIALGHNNNVSWAATVSRFDLIDIYQETISADSKGDLLTLYKGNREPVKYRNEKFRMNQVTDGKNDNVVDVPAGGAIPSRLPFVPRHNNAPLFASVSLSYVGVSPTLDLEAFLGFNRAKTVQDFQKAAQNIGSLSFNFAVAATNGDIAYYSTGQVPLREDLQAGAVVGVPPSLIREGSGGNEWLPLSKQNSLGLTYQTVPFEEMPQLVNPAAGFIISANNDPLGLNATNRPLENMRPKGGIFYLGASFDDGSRAHTLTVDLQNAIANGGKVSLQQAVRFQASTKMHDAEIFLPFIQQAFTNAQSSNAPPALAALGTDAGIKEALDHFSQWDFSTPTGIRLGYDSFVPYNQSDPSEATINNSISTTIYSVWRSNMVRSTLDGVLASRKLNQVPGDQLAIAALRNLLENFSTNRGLGKSGLPFLGAADLPDATPEVQRDLTILRALKKTLDDLAGNNFANAYKNSTSQRDYRWGFLHRVFFQHRFGLFSEFGIPSQTGNFKSPLPGLFGLPRDGGFDVPNASSNPLRAETDDDFFFTAGSSERLTSVFKPNGIEAFAALPGGQSGDLKSKFHDNLLGMWLVGDLYPLSLMESTSVKAVTVKGSSR